MRPSPKLLSGSGDTKCRCSAREPTSVVRPMSRQKAPCAGLLCSVGCEDPVARFMMRTTTTSEIDTKTIVVMSSVVPHLSMNFPGRYLVVGFCGIGHSCAKQSHDSRRSRRFLGSPF